MDDRPGELDKLKVLAEPVRRRLYEHVVAQGDPVDRDGAATALGIGRPLAAFHLDRLVAGGLLDVEYHRRSGRTGPGAGRPAKFYRRAAGHQVDVSLPPRRYGLAAEILAAGVDHTSDPGAREMVLDSARKAGERLAAPTRDPTGSAGLLRILAANGYEPAEEPGGVIRLRNCPFDALVERHRALTCSMNLALLEAVAATIAEPRLAARARARDGWCCVEFAPAP